jgi:hypothetical protein
MSAGFSWNPRNAGGHRPPELEKEASWAVADPASVVGSSGNCGAGKDRQTIMFD